MSGIRYYILKQKNKKALTDVKVYGKIHLMTFEQEQVPESHRIKRIVGRCKTITEVWRIHLVSRGFKVVFINE